MPEDLDIRTDRKVYSIPEGLNELVYDISKEVLRCQPKNLYQFISDYLITLLKVREAVKVAVPIIEKEFQSAESQTNFLKKYNLSKEQGDRFATIIQAAFRGYRIRKKLLHIGDDFIKAEEAYLFDSVSEEGFFTDPLFEFLRTRGVPMEKTIEAATKIQAFYRGYKVRKLEKEKGVECLIHGVPSHESWRHDWLNETAPKKDSSHSPYPWRKSFADFHKNYTRRSEGDRLHIETIFGGKYEDYNRVCDLTSCQQFIVPTVSEAKELATPGDIESLLSEELDIPGGQIMRDMVASSIKESPVSYEQAEREEKLYRKLSEHKKSILSEKFESEPDDNLQSRESIPKSSRSSRKSDVASVKSEGSKSKGSKKSVSVKSQPSEQSAAPPELSIRSLSVDVEEIEKEESLVAEEGVSDVSEVSVDIEEKGTQESRKSSVKSLEKVSSTIMVDEEEKEYKGSKKSDGSGSAKSGSKKSIVAAEQEQE